MVVPDKKHVEASDTVFPTAPHLPIEHIAKGFKFPLGKVDAMDFPSVNLFDSTGNIQFPVSLKEMSSTMQAVLKSFAEEARSNGDKAVMPKDLETFIRKRYLSFRNNPNPSVEELRFFLKDMRETKNHERTAPPYRNESNEFLFPPEIENKPDLKALYKLWVTANENPKIQDGRVLTPVPIRRALREYDRNATVSNVKSPPKKGDKTKKKKGSKGK